MPVGQEGYPRWWPTVVSAAGVGLAYLIAIQRINLPWLDPVVMGMIGTWPVDLITRSRRTKESK